MSGLLLPDMGKMVFIVEDDPGVRELYTEALDLEGVAGYAFGSTKEALAALSGHTPFALITDVDGLGETDGLMLAKTLLERRPDLPVLVVSGGDYRESARKLGVPFLQKPARLATLLDLFMSLIKVEHLVPA